ncbi:hypothetical protein LINPERHAP1_LOCUS35737 [Linum perenne]
MMNINKNMVVMMLVMFILFLGAHPTFSTRLLLQQIGQFPLIPLFHCFIFSVSLTSCSLQF